MRHAELVLDGAEGWGPDEAAGDEDDHHALTCRGVVAQADRGCLEDGREGGRFEEHDRSRHPFDVLAGDQTGGGGASDGAGDEHEQDNAAAEWDGPDRTVDLGKDADCNDGGGEETSCQEEDLCISECLGCVFGRLARVDLQMGNNELCDGDLRCNVEEVREASEPQPRVGKADDRVLPQSPSTLRFW